MSKLRGLASRLGTLPSQLTLSAQQAEAHTATRVRPLGGYGALAPHGARRFASSSSSGFDDQKKQLVSNHLLVDTLDLVSTMGQEPGCFASRLRQLGTVRRCGEHQGPRLLPARSCSRRVAQLGVRGRWGF